MKYLSVNNRSLTIQQALRLNAMFGRRMRLREMALEYLLILDYAGEQGISVSPEELRFLIGEWRYLKKLENQEKLSGYLRDHNLDAATVRDYFSFVELNKKVVAGIPDQEVSLYFAEHRTSYDRAEVVLMTTDREDVALEVKALVEDDGEPLQGYAATYSLDRDLAKKGGYLGFQSRSFFTGEEEALVFSGEPGSVIGPFKGEKGVLKLYQVLAVNAPTLEGEAGEIRQILMQDLMRKLRLEARITDHLLDPADEET